MIMYLNLTTQSQPRLRPEPNLIAPWLGAAALLDVAAPGFASILLDDLPPAPPLPLDLRSDDPRFDVPPPPPSSRRLLAAATLEYFSKAALSAAEHVGSSHVKADFGALAAFPPSELPFLLLPPPAAPLVALDAPPFEPLDEERRMLSGGSSASCGGDESREDSRDSRSSGFSCCAASRCRPLQL